MTENKRFRMTETELIFMVLDNETPLSRKEIVDKLNNFNDENEQLQFELKECSDRKLFSRRELEKENERIKHIIQEAYNNERTQIGKSVLKQLMEQIQ